MESKIYSFDIFDTCYVRKCGKQDFLFELLAKRVLGSHAEVSSVYDFVLARRAAEEQARKHSMREDVLLDEIYAHFDVSMFTTLGSDAVMEEELRVHRDMLVPVEMIKREVERLHSLGQSVVYISDMYLPVSFLAEKLSQDGFLSEGDRLYVSGEVGLTKSSGRLYDHVRQELGTTFSDWLHRGDNSYSDFAVPRKKGIHAVQVDTGYSYYERLLMSRDVSGSTMDVLKLAACGRAVAHSLPSTPAHAFATDFIAPIYVPFVYSILLDARKRGLKRLFFVARDGYILYRIAEVFRADFPDIGLSYLWASRKSLYLPGLKDLSSDSLAEAFPAMSADVGQLLSLLHMSDYPLDMERMKGMPAQEIANLLVHDDQFMSVLAGRYEEQSTLAIEYFRQEGVTTPGSAIVDVFGTRKCEYFLNNILARNGYNKVHGYYYSVMWGRMLMADSYSSMMYVDRLRYGANDAYYTQKQSILEQYFSVTDQERTVGYRHEYGRVVPLYEKDAVSQEFKKDALKVNLTVCQLFAGFYKSVGIENHDLCCQAAQAVYNAFFHVPRKEYLSALSAFVISDDNRLSRILEKRPLLTVLLQKRSSDRWFHGNIVFNSGFLYKPMLWLLEKLWERQKNKSLNNYV